MYQSFEYHSTRPAAIERLAAVATAAAAVEEAIPFGACSTHPGYSARAAVMEWGVREAHHLLCSLCEEGATVAAWTASASAEASPHKASDGIGLPPESDQSEDARTWRALEPLFGPAYHGHDAYTGRRFRMPNCVGLAITADFPPSVMVVGPAGSAAGKESLGGRHISWPPRQGTVRFTLTGEQIIFFRSAQHRTEYEKSRGVPAGGAT